MGSNERKRRKFYQQLVILFLIVLAGYYLVSVYLIPAIDQSRVCGYFRNAGQKTGPRVCLEIADTEGERAKGLMFRKAGELGAEEGMIFVYDSENVNSFWMKNTYIALDMIFLDSKFQVVGIVENAEPLTETSRKVEAKSRYVVEVLGGKTKQWGVSKGFTLQLDREIRR